MGYSGWTGWFELSIRLRFYLVFRIWRKSLNDSFQPKRNLRGLYVEMPGEYIV